MSLEIPNSVTDIGANAFSGNSFPSYVVSIPNESATVDNTAFDSRCKIVAIEGTDSCFEISK